MLAPERSDQDTFIRSKTADHFAPELDDAAYEPTIVKQEVLPVHVSSTTVDEPPDGGLQAWLVLLGAFLDLFSTFGVVNSYVSYPYP